MALTHVVVLIVWITCAHGYTRQLHQTSAGKNSAVNSAASLQIQAAAAAAGLNVVRRADGTLVLADKVLVVLKEGTVGMADTDLNGLRVSQVVTNNIIEFTVTDNSTLDSKISNMSATQGVESAEPVYIVSTQQTIIPSDPMYNSQWGLRRIQANAAWAKFQGKAKGTVTVCVVDTGIDFDHEDLKLNIDKSKISTGDGRGSGLDDNGHGTHCAGVIGAVGNNKQGVAGINWKVKLAACKFLQANGLGTLTDAIACFAKCRAAGAKVYSSSFSFLASEEPQSMKAEMAKACNAGGVIVVAAGNDAIDNDDVSLRGMPSSIDLPCIVSVGASEQNDFQTSFSNYGRTSVDLFAPGLSITSTYRGNSYKSISGTSMACPHVSGAAAFLMSLNPALSGTQVKKLIMDNVDRVDSLQYMCATGGRLNLLKAANAAVASSGGPSTPTSSSASAKMSCTLNLYKNAAAQGLLWKWQIDWESKDQAKCHTVDRVPTNVDNKARSITATCTCSGTSCYNEMETTIYYLYLNSLSFLPAQTPASFNFQPTDKFCSSSSRCGVRITDLPPPYRANVSAMTLCIKGARPAVIGSSSDGTAETKLPVTPESTSENKMIQILPVPVDTTGPPNGDSATVEIEPQSTVDATTASTLPPDGDLITEPDIPTEDAATTTAG